MWNNIVSQKDDFLKACLLWNVSNRCFFGIVPSFSKLQHSFTSKDRSILKIIFNRKYFNRCILKRFWEIWFVFFAKNTNYTIFPRLLLGVIWVKTWFFRFENVNSQCLKPFWTGKYFFENGDTKGIWGEIIVDFHF